MKNDAFVEKKNLIDINNINFTLNNLKQSNVSEIIENVTDLTLFDVNNLEILLNINFLKESNNLLTEIILPKSCFCYVNAKIIAKNYKATIKSNIKTQQNLLNENCFNKNIINLLKKTG